MSPGNWVPGSLAGRKHLATPWVEMRGCAVETAWVQVEAAGLAVGGGHGWRVPTSDSLRVTRKESTRLHLSR